jgi:pyridoxine kinase
MPLVLIISSHVAASRVGAKPVEHALHARKIDTIVCPTTLMGRHPGWGPPGGGVVRAETLASMLAGVEANGLFRHVDAVATGYFADADQVAAAVAAIRAVRAANPKALIAVDPIMGDDPGGLYVGVAAADALAQTLAPLADLIAPNLWELSRLAGRALIGEAEVCAAARALGQPALVSSIRAEGGIGALYIDSGEAWRAIGPEARTAPNGTGDLLFGVFLAARLEGLTGAQALHRAVGVVGDVAAKAALWGAPELPIVAAPDAFIAPSVAVQLSPLQ